MSLEAGTIIKHGWMFMVANVVNRAAGLLLLPLYTKVLSPAEFGVYALISVVGDIVAVMLMIGMINAFTVVYFEHPDDKGRSRVVSTTMIGLWVASLALLAVSFPGGWAASHMLFGTSEQAPIVAFAFAGIAFSAVFELALAYYRVHKRSGTCLLISVGKAVGLIGLNLSFLLAMDLGVTGIFLANAITFVGLGVGLTVAILAANGVSFSFGILKRVAALGLPFMPQTMLDMGNQFAMRYLVNLLMGVAAVGVLSFGLRLATLLYMFLTASFLQIWSVSRIEAQDSTAGREQSEFVFYLFLVLLTAAGLGMALTAPEVLWLIASHDYAPVLPCMPLLVLAYVLHGVRMHAEVGLVKTKKVGVLPMISLGGVVVGTLIMAATLGPLGLMGGAVGVLLRELFMVGATEALCRRLSPKEPPLGVLRVLGILAPATIAYLAGLALFGFEVDPTFAAAKVGLTLLAAIAALFGPSFGKTDRAMLSRMLGRFLRRPQAA
ncbi:lipopolysaccharide biosynthesis protein [Azospirillum picis]|uniref:O-antigen/teichoic acid export membrane protein n=1 Tax=Azospirillum picis TaxID=488438 RepID=A0ABU0MHE4_9PROT|nr:oligosaccharide flippase family protein [Azospirillum picis]MBP2299107.1 O-antigen/teichoic acid export membrane protein [Azospirillum picis]MDQ0532651.1 O-antigen/teichoic acid export membrane protein [Azospirillum picis]